MQIEGLADLTPQGSGGFSQVFSATETRYNRTVAAKVLNFRLESDEDQQRFEQECRAMAQLSDHPHIVPLYFTTYTDQGFPVIVMEYFTGGTLSQRARNGASHAELLDAGVKMASALHCAHQRGVTHRDVKPQNVLLSSFGEPALTDFGISAITHQREATEKNEGITLAYAAPEAFEGQSNARTDGYSLAATLYTVLAGRRPFDAPQGRSQSTGELVRRIMSEEAPSLQQYGLSNEVDRAIRRIGMARDPRQRPADAREFGELLRNLQRQEGYEPTAWVEAIDAIDSEDTTIGPPDSMTVIRTHQLDQTPAPATPEPPTETQTWTRRRVLALGAGIVALTALAFAVFVAGRSSTEPIAEPAPPVLSTATDDNFYAGPIFPPTDITIERVGDGTAVVTWVDANVTPVEFEIQRIDADGRDLAPIITDGTSATLNNIGDTVSPCITMRAIRDLQTSGDIDSPLCLGPSAGNSPLVAVDPSRCAVGTCEVRLDASGFTPVSEVSILIDSAEGPDLNTVVPAAYETAAVVNAAGEIDWLFNPSDQVAAGTYRVAVTDGQTGLSTVAFLTLTAG